MRRIASMALFAGLCMTLGCGSDFEPAARPASGEPTTVGPVFDVEVTLPQLSIDGDPPGAFLELRLDLERGGTGEIPTRVTLDRFVSGMQTLPVIDLSQGPDTARVTETTFTLTGIGPIRVGTTMFTLSLDGTFEENGSPLERNGGRIPERARRLCRSVATTALSGHDVDVHLAVRSPRRDRLGKGSPAPGPG